MPTHYIQTIMFIFAATFVVANGFAQPATPPPTINIVRDGAGVHAMFTGGLQSADTVAGPWTDMVAASSPLTIPTNRTSMFFRAVEKRNQMRIKIGSSTFIATFYDNPTAAAFKAMLPMTITMSELNGNEKYFSLSSSLPTNASNPRTIQSGDLMIYGANVLVLFYQTFSTSYSYTPLGRVNDATGLAAAVGSGSVTITYELE
ncbi:MAG: hypothetical protein L0Z50_29575 [Verrucomicrobiales bacterium]|nr:hypothetical protein [Verrucomicrobiales bacterium]